MSGLADGVHHLGHALLVLLMQPLACALNAGSDPDGLGQRFVAFLQWEVFCSHGR